MSAFEEYTKTFNATDYYQVPQPIETKKNIMQQTMIRVKDPKKSLDFYIKTLGFVFLHHMDFPQWGFSVYFVAYLNSEDRCNKIPPLTDMESVRQFCMTTPGCVEITWNHGSEILEDEFIYNTGNGDHTGTTNGEKIKGGFGHLGITVPDVYEACERYKTLGVKFHKSPNAGGMKGLAFIKDPDNYLIEILPQGAFIEKEIDCNGVSLTGGPGYQDNSKA